MLRTETAELVQATVRLPGVDLHVPALCNVEIVSGLRRAAARRILTEPRAREAIRDYLDLPLTRHGHTSLLDRMFELRANLSAYDATYVALAEVIGAELLTADDGLARAVESHTRVALAR